MTDKFEIADDMKPAALAALYNASQPLGMGFLHVRDEDMGVDEAAELLKTTGYFDYLHGRVMKLNFDLAPLWLGLYDRDNGAGAGERALRAANVI